MEKRFNMNFKNKVALVTGAVEGIGCAVAILFDQNGALLAISAMRQAISGHKIQIEGCRKKR